MKVKSIAECSKGSMSRTLVIGLLSVHVQNILLSNFSVSMFRTFCSQTAQCPHSEHFVFKLLSVLV